MKFDNFDNNDIVIVDYPSTIFEPSRMTKSLSEHLREMNEHLARLSEMIESQKKIDERNKTIDNLLNE